MVAGLEELEDRVERREPGAEREAVGATLQRGDVPLQRFPGGILGAGVLVALVPSQPLLPVGRGLVDRGHHRAGQRVRHLAGVDRAGRERMGAVAVEDPSHVEDYHRRIYLARVTPPSNNRQPMNTARALVVDDDAQVRHTLARILQAQGMATIEAANGRQAIRHLEDGGGIPLVVSDIYMPEMDGIALLKEVHRRWPDVAVNMLTGVAEVTTAVECLQLGALDYLSKPVLVDEVRAR